MYVILDPHNFARCYPDPANYQSSAQGLIGSATVSDADFADFWSRPAAIYRTNDHVIFNLMNEPNAIQEAAWVSAANDAIATIRATDVAVGERKPNPVWHLAAVRLLNRGFSRPEERCLDKLRFCDYEQRKSRNRHHARRG
jgi:hypothetical protein